VTLTTSIEVSRPPNEVFAFVTDPSRFGEWQDGVIEGATTDAAAHVGTRCVTTRKIGFMRRAATSEITHIDPPRTWGVRGVDGPIRATVDVTVDPAADGASRVTIDVEFQGRGIGKVLVPLAVRRQASKEMLSNMRRLKQRLETRGE
jgi:carbon monoxide dehydrogenase subunit G